MIHFRTSPTTKSEFFFSKNQLFGELIIHFFVQNVFFFLQLFRLILILNGMSFGELFPPCPRLIVLSTFDHYFPGLCRHVNAVNVIWTNFTLDLVS